MILRGSVFSRILEMETGLTVISPQDYLSDQPYKIVYLLHGLCGNNGNWADYTMLPVYALDCHAIFVMPEVARSFYADQTYGQRFFSYVADELPMICKRTFNISAARADTAIMGGSMGGYGALKIALSRPDQYGFCASFAAACLYLGEQIQGMLRLNDMEKIREQVGEQIIRDFEAVLGPKFETRTQDRVLDLAKAAPAANRPRIYSACGTEDDLLTENRRFRDDMTRLGYNFVYEEWKGDHDWPFFDAALKKGLDAWLGDEKR